MNGHILQVQKLGPALQRHFAQSEEERGHDFDDPQLAREATKLAFPVKNKYRKRSVRSYSPENMEEKKS